MRHLLLGLLLATSAWAFDGDVKTHSNSWAHIALIDGTAATATTNGVWVDVGKYQLGLLEGNGAAGGTVVEIDGSNNPTKPAAASNGYAIFLSTANTAFVQPIAPYATAAPDTTPATKVMPRWIKARVTVLGTGTVSVWLKAFSTGGS